MSFEDKIFEYIANNNMFNENFWSVIDRVTLAFGAQRKDVANAINSLIKSKRVAVKNKTLVDLSEYYVGPIKVFKDNIGFVDYNGKKYMINGVKGAQDGDIVTFALNQTMPGTARIGTIKAKAEVLVVGRLVKDKRGLVYLIPDNEKFGKVIAVPQGDLAQESVGKKVSVLCKPNNSGILHGEKFDKILGLAGDPIVENVAIAAQYGFTKEFNQKIKDFVKENVPDHVLPEEYVGRVDLRHKKFITIDPKSCKDMDDAVCVEKTKDGYKFYVAIADVAHYVKKGSILDIEAEKRSLSAYLGDGVYPMIAEELSNGICSLNPNVDRLTKVVEIDITKDGVITNTNIYNAVINSKHKLAYEDADEIHFNKNGAEKKFADVKEQIDDMFKVSDLLLAARLKRGELRFETDSVDFVLDETKTVVLDVDNTHDNLKSTKIIESFMIAANEAVGQFLIDNEYDTLFRTLYGPTDAGIAQLNMVLEEWGLGPIGNDRHDYQRIIQQVKRHPLKEYLMYKLLGPIPKAKYEPTQNGHYALAAKNYLHFTSPIRRYPDLVTHRVLDCCLAKKPNIYDMNALIFEGMHSSEREVKQQKADDESVKLMKAMWAENQVGKVFEGTVFDITDEGVIVKLDNKVELLVPYNGAKLNMNNTKTMVRFGGKAYMIGDRMKVSIEKADRAKRLTYAKDIEKVYDGSNLFAKRNYKEETYGL